LIRPHNPRLVHLAQAGESHEGVVLHGHFTHLRAAFWKTYVAEFLKELPAQQM
jgi:hypothetical protein